MNRINSTYTFSGMHSIKRIIALFFVSLLFIACSGDEIVYKEYKELGSDVQWKKSDPRTFDIDIRDNSTPLKFILAFRYATGYMFDKVIIRMTENAPSGKKTIRDIEIPVRDSSGQFIGEKGFDIIDLEYVIDAEKNYPSHGVYTYTLEQAVPGVDPLHYAMEIGLILKKKKEK
ncbi:MAG: hypothetical protein IT223_00440 [Crocinitomicaceae bacterium]|nr:hypothetical protein [Crocinitomicaceae bacterium]